VRLDRDGSSNSGDTHFTVLAHGRKVFRGGRSPEQHSVILLSLVVGARLSVQANKGKVRTPHSGFVNYRLLSLSTCVSMTVPMTPFPLRA
jgi:hypothetical protein